ncbi:hypothetical protein BJY00DRAFT_317524 [Aspergillus carlsbadensis]|nr:hypothetical protein BJY00DRAFT_317524 [Aspergillus carlsbadensis]
MLAGHSVTRGFAGQQLVTFHLPQPLEPWLPPTNLPAEPGTPGHRSEQASVPRRGRIGRASPKPRPAPPVAAPPPPRPPPPPPPRPTATWADDEYGFSELSGSEDSGNLENEDKEVNSLTSGQGKQVKRVTWFSMRATSALPPAFFPVLSKRQMHKILVWWSQTHSQGGRPYTIHRRLYLAYTEWALHHGWYDPARSRFEMHFNVLCATMGIGRRQRVSTTCDRCVAHHAEGRCDADNVNACLVCLKAEAPCTRTNLDATRTHYLNGTANVPPGSDLRVTPAGQNVSYVNMRVPRQLIIDLFPPGTAGKYLKATSAPAPPPAPPRAPPRPFAQAGLPLGYMPGQPWQSALPQRQVPPKQPRRLQPAIPQQQAPPEPPQLVAGVGQTGGSMHEQLNAWGAHQLHWNRQHRESQQRQTALRGALFALGINPDVDSRLLPLPPVLPQLDPIANAQLQAQQERARFEQCEAENVRLREVIDATTRARAGSTLPIDPALTQQSPFAQQPRAQQPSVQQTPHQQTSQAGAAAANPFAPMSLDARAGQPQSLTDNVNQGNNAPPRRQRNTLTLGRTRLHSPTRRRAVGQQTTSQATAGQAATTQAPTGPTGPTSTNPRTRASGGGPLAPRLTTAARVTKPKDRQQDTSGTNRPSMKELKQRRKELKAMQASGELDDENTDIPEDLSLLWGIYAPTGEQVSSGSEDEGGDEDNIAGPGAGTGNSANPAPISNVTVQNPGVVGGTGTGSGTAETTTQQANVNPQMVPYPDMDAAIANYLQNEFDSGDGSFMNMLEDDAAMMLDYNPNMGVHGNVDSVAGQQQPDQGEDFDLEDWVNS